MRVSISLIFLLICTQTGSPLFYVEKIESNSKYDSRYVFSRAFEILPQDRLVNEANLNRDVECLTNELKVSGIFEAVKVQLTDSSNKRAKQAFINVTYHSGIEEFTIDDIVLENFPVVPELTFKDSLKRRDVKQGTKLLKYFFSELEEKVGEALAEAYPKDSYKDNQTYWLTIRPLGKQKVRLVVSPSYIGCKSSAER